MPTTIKELEMMIGRPPVSVEDRRNCVVIYYDNNLRVFLKKELR